jgi:hypothetical protein
MWRPLQARSSLDDQGLPTNLSGLDLQRIEEVLGHAWTEPTRETYGAGLLVFHIYCDTKNIGELQRAPASSLLISAFAAALAGAYSAKTISNYISGIRAWHILHGIAWSTNQQELISILRAAEAVAPTSSKRKKRLPYTPQFIETILTHLDLKNPLDAAVYACVTTTFYSCARLGEFTVPRLSAFDAQLHVKPSDIRESTDRHGNQVTSFFLPRTKVTQNGEEVSWAQQEGPTDPRKALENHLRVNEPTPNSHLFAYKSKAGLRPLTKRKALERIAKAARDAGVDPLQGHSIRIGATLEYLLRGVPFDVVKVMGRWASNAFTVYLRKHAQILAPYLQAKPEVHEHFVRLTMPPVR